MIPDVQALAVLTGLVWGLQPIASRRALAAGGNPLQVTVGGIGVAFAVSWVVLYAAAGGSGLLAAVPLLGIGVFLLEGALGNTFGRLAYNVGIERVGASVASASSNTYPLFASVFALALLFEPIRPHEAVGMVVIVGGLVVLALSKGGNIGGWALGDLAFPVGAAVMWGFGTVLGRFGLTATGATAIQATTLNMTAAFATILLYAGARGGRARFDAPARSYRYVFLAGLLGIAGFFFLFEALDRGRVVIVAPLAATAPLFTTLFTRVLLGDLERVTRGVVVGTAVVVVGVALMTV